jgi:DNA repair protein RadC
VLLRSGAEMKKEEWQERGKGHRERLRQRFVSGGLEQFTDEEVVEFLLTLGTPRGDLKNAARDAMKRFGTLSGVLSAPAKRPSWRSRASEKRMRFTWV